MAKIDVIWEMICQQYNVLQKVQRDGFCKISAEQIKKFAEPRLMTKFDHYAQLPDIFKLSNLSLLPIDRGDYIISNIRTFYSFPPEQEHIKIIDKRIPNYIESIDFSNITSESIALNCAFLSDIITDFSGEERLYPTVDGRMASDTFSFQIERSTQGKPLLVDVKNAQIEIDGGYEGAGSLVLIEAKNHLCTDFIIRQLYYPYRKWQQKIQKKVRPVFMEYSNGIFRLREYKFADLSNYNSLYVINDRKYRLRDDTQITKSLIYNLLSSVSFEIEPTDVPFPQADSFERIINLCEILWGTNEFSLTKEDLNYNLNFTVSKSFTHRQVDYYTNAAIYLNLVVKSTNRPVTFALSQPGYLIFSKKRISDRQLCLIQRILSFEVFARVMRYYLEFNRIPDQDKVVEIMQSVGVNIGETSVYRRRAQTVLAWIKWIISSLDE